jgi:hypothetical protein
LETGAAGCYLRESEGILLELLWASWQHAGE